MLLLVFIFNSSASLYTHLLIAIVVFFKMFLLGIRNWYIGNLFCVVSIKKERAKTVWSFSAYSTQWRYRFK